MEMQKRVIMIGGIPSAGKTTLARKMKDIIGVDKEFCTDFVYFEIGRELGVGDFANPNVWKKEDAKKVLEFKNKFYREMLPRKDVVLLEGYGLLFKEDREIVKDFYQDYKIIFIYKDIDLKSWLKQKGVIECSARIREFNYLKEIATIEKETITVI